MSNVTPFLPALNPQTIAEEQVSVARLSDVLQSAFLDHEIDDGDLYITDGVEYPIGWPSQRSQSSLRSLRTSHLKRQRPWTGSAGSTTSTVRSESHNSHSSGTRCGDGTG